jgi:hypothetical protein
MDERRKWENVNTEESRKNYRRLRNELKEHTDNSKKKYHDNIVTKVWNFQEQGFKI